MKELSIEQKAKAYDKALEKARQLCAYPTSKPFISDLQDLFPELKESEDEMIRKDIVEAVELHKGFTQERKEYIYDWLEKQGEQKPVFEMKSPEESLGVDSDTYNKIVDECIYGEQKPADKIESRQEELTEFEKAVKQVMEEAIECGDTHNLKADADMLLRLVQKPAAWSEEDKAMLTLVMVVLSANKDDEHFTMSDTTVEDCFNWFKSLKDRVQPQKQEWSDVDKDILFRTINNLKFLRDTISIDPNYAINIINIEREITWLKSIKDRVQLQPKQEWSEEDEKVIDDAESWLDMLCSYLKNNSSQYIPVVKEVISKLKSLRPQSQWKPSEGQLECLGYAIEKAEKDWSPLTNNRVYLTLKTLKEQLLELRGSKV